MTLTLESAAETWPQAGRYELLRRMAVGGMGTLEDRATDWRAVLSERLAVADEGEGSVIVIRGAPGAGRTTSLSHAGVAGSQAGFQVSTPMPQDLETWVPGDGADEPGVILVDDVDLAFRNMGPSLQRLAQLLRGSRTILIATCDEASRAQLPGSVHQATLPSLSLAALACVAATELGGGDLPEVAQHLVASRCDGNPLVACLLTRILLDRGHLVLVEGRWVLRGTLTAASLPSGLQDSVALLLGRLPSAVACFLLAAARVGQTFKREDAERVAGMRAAGCVARAVSSSFIEATSNGGYTFRQPCVRRALLLIPPRSLASKGTVH